MFQSPNSTSKPSIQNVKVVNLKTLGEKKTVKKANVLIVPLFGAIGKGDFLQHTDMPDYRFEFFQYQFLVKGEDGKPVTKKVRWVNSFLKAGKDDGVLNDPGITLGLDLPPEMRSFIPGFGVQGQTFADPSSLALVYRLPILWGVQKNKSGNITDGSGELALLEVNEAQFNNIVRIMKGYDKAKILYEWYEGEDELADPKYNYEGIGCAIELTKDTSLGTGTYAWKLSPATVRKSHWESHIASAKEALENYKKTVFQYSLYYKKFIDEYLEGKLDAATAEQQVVASIAQKLLEAWGETFEETTVGVLEAFAAVAPKYALTKGAGISKVATAKAVTIPMDGGDDEESTPF